MAAPGRYVVLLRGINVNPTTRVSMEELRSIVGGLGYSDVRTILQSGNVLVTSAAVPDVPKLEEAIASGTGVRSKVIALEIDAFRSLVEQNPLLDVSDDLSKMVITFLGSRIDPADMVRPSDRELAAERLVITPAAVYQFCPLGILKSQLKPQWWKQFGPEITARNVRTANRILAAVVE
jgi:uncharacterized protein (DUF1697 family)